MDTDKIAPCDIGVYGLAVMGQNLALNIADNGYKVAVYNRTSAKTEEFMQEKVTQEQKDAQTVQAAYEIEDFMNKLAEPRVILLMVKAGGAVDAVIDALKPHLKAGDTLIDGGNSYFEDTDRRTEALAKDDIRYIGMGISGGEEGARHGPSLMPGGEESAYERVQPIMEAIAADFKGEPCVTYLGPRSAGHYVKMVHNGIEYGNMQAIAEAYDLMRRALRLEPERIGKVFTQWNKGELASFLIDITAQIFTRNDDETGKPLINLILDKAQQKGTGKWTTQDALNIGATVPTITQAVEARIISSFKEEREHASPLLEGPKGHYEGNISQFITALGDALFATMVCAYAQGFDALRRASAEYDYKLKLGDIARIWRNGCIIRADILDEMSKAFDEQADLNNLILADYFRTALAEKQVSWRLVIAVAVQTGVPVPAMGSALAYYDSYRSTRLPANLIQAQRDFFGAHTYERIDKEGTFHTEWATKTEQDHDNAESDES